MKSKVTPEDIELLDKLVMDNFQQHKSETDWIVQDGIIDLDSYNSAKYRILWILREVHEIDEGDTDDKFGNWDYRELIRRFINGEEALGKSAKVIKPIVYTSFGILNDSDWNGMDYIENDYFNMIGVLNSIAYINLKKQPGKTRSFPKEIREHYLRDEKVILQQIEKFNPNIIICGGTLNDYLITGLKLKEENAKNIGWLKCYLQNGNIYIRANHPSAPVKRVEYVDGIINAVRIWEKSKSDK